MTIAIAVKVNDGVVLASDSATTVVQPGSSPGSFGVANIYNNGTKIFRLHKELPLAAITWGVANIGMSSLKVLAKDFRAELMSDTSQFDPMNYTVEDVAQRFKAFMYDGHYAPAYDQAQRGGFGMGFKIAGYGPGQPRGEVWHLEFDVGTCTGPRLDIPQDEPAGLAVEGTPAPVRRWVIGFDPEELAVVLTRAGLQPDQITDIIKLGRTMLFRRLVHPAMPIQDAIDLAIFLEQVAAQFVRFREGPDTVGGPVEVATLTKYEGFKWVHRKHYYDKNLNG